MIGKNGKGVRLRRKPAVWLTLARILAVLVVASIPLACNAFTAAKYLAAATAEADARVAIWDVAIDSDDLPATVKSINARPPYNDGAQSGGHPLVLFFQGKKGSADDPTSVLKDAAFTMTFTNDSEVAARFIPDITVETPEDDDAFAVVKSCIHFYDAVDDASHKNDFAEEGLILAPGVSKVIDVVIESCTFTDLKIGAIVEQAN